MFVRAVATVTILGQNRLNIAHEIHSACGSRRQLRRLRGGASDNECRAGKHFPETGCNWSQQRHNNGKT